MISEVETGYFHVLGDYVRYNNTPTVRRVVKIHHIPISSLDFLVVEPQMEFLAAGIDQNMKNFDLCTSEGDILEWPFRDSTS